MPVNSISGQAFANMLVVRQIELKAEPEPSAGNSLEPR
jgi:hypothetical protein